MQDGSSAEAVGSSLTAGRHLSIRATEGNIEAKGAQISAEGDALLYARDDIRLLAAADSRRQTGSSMGIGAGYGGSLKGGDGFNQSAFGRASQTAGQNMNKGFNYSPTLPQHESGDSQGYTRSVLSEGNITIGGKKTSARALGIHTDSATAHHGADSVPDLQNLLDKQQTVAQSTAAIHSAVATYRGNRAKAATQELEKQQAAHEGSLKERNDGSYEHYLSLSDAQRQQEMLAHSPAYAQAYQEARSWGVGGSKSRALSAAETLITGALGGQGDLQLAANTLAPYAAAAIGKRFGHGEHKNEAAQAIGHFMLGAALAYANGADPLAGGSAAVAAERAAEYLAKQYDDGKTAIDPITGKFNPNLLPEHIKEEIKAQTGAVASVVGAAGGSLNGTNGANTNALFNAQVGGVLGQNAVENNWSGSQKYRNDLLNRARQDEDKAKKLLIIDKKLQKLGVIDVEPVAIYYEQCNGCADADHKYGAIRKRNDQIVSHAIQSGTLNDSELSLIQEDAENRVKSLRSLGFSNYPLTAEVHAQANILDFILEERMKRDRISLSPTEQVSYILLKSGMGSSPKGIRGSNFGNLRRVTPQKSGKPSENYGTPTPPQNYKADNIGKSNLPPTTSKAPVPIVRKAEAPSGKAVPVGEVRIPSNPKAVKGTTVTLSQEQRLANGELIPKGSVVTWSDNAVKVVRPDGIKKIFNSKILEGSTASVYESKQLINSQQLISIWQNNPQSIWGLSAVRIAEHFNNAGYKATVRQSTQGSGKALIVKIEGHKTITQIQVHPGGGRHGGEYYKISTTDKGKIKIVNPKTYNKTNEKATILYK